MPQSNDLDQRYAAARRQLAAGREQLGAALRELRALLPQVTSARPRGRLNSQIWECERALGRRDSFFSQSGQDAWLYEHVFPDVRGGTFVEIGGYDGITGSNCLFFELMLGWSGVLVEPSPTYYPRAAAFRRCDCLAVALAAAEGEAEFLDVRAGMKQMGGLVDNYDAALRRQVEQDPRHRGEVIRVPTRTLGRILDDAGLRAVDYVSLDVEGAEQAVLEGFDFDRYRVTAWTIENNLGDTSIPAMMERRGYRRVEALGVDDVYVLQSR